MAFECSTCVTAEEHSSHVQYLEFKRGGPGTSIDMELWSRVRAGDLEAREQAIVQNYGLARRIAGRMQRGLPPHVDPEDVVGFATLGLMRAVKNYDPTMGVRFEVFAATAIRSLILDELRSLDWAPRSLRRKQREVTKVTDQLVERLDREPTSSEVAGVLGWEQDDVVEVNHKVLASYHSSLDELSHTWDAVAGRDAESGEDAYVESSHMHEVMEMVSDEIRAMPVLDQAVVALYYFGEKKFAGVAQALGITETRASAIHGKVVMSVRERFRELLT